MADNATTPVEKTYLELISQDKKEVKAAEYLEAAQKASLSTQTDIVKLNSEIATAKTRLAKAKSLIPYSAIGEYKATKTVADLEEQLEFVKSVYSSRFTDAAIQ